MDVTETREKCEDVGVSREHYLGAAGKGKELRLWSDARMLRTLSRSAGTY